MAGFMALPTLTPVEAALLREVRLSDEDHGGLGGAELCSGTRRTKLAPRVGGGS